MVQPRSRRDSPSAARVQAEPPNRSRTRLRECPSLARTHGRYRSCPAGVRRTGFGHAAGATGWPQGQRDAVGKEIAPGGINAIDDCDDTSASPCIEWAKTGSDLSINVDVFLHSSLSSEEVDLKTDLRNTFTKYNAIAARNPHLQETTSGASDEIHVNAVNLSDPTVYAGTTPTYNLSSPYHITHVEMSFNTLIFWIRTSGYSCVSGPTMCEADAGRSRIMRWATPKASGTSVRA